VDELEAPIEVVWKLVESFEDLSAWAPDATVVEVKGEGVGAVRRVQGSDPGVGQFVERCEGVDPEKHTFSYAVIESPAPIADYVAVVKLTALGPERCGIDWSSRFEPVGLPEAQVVGMIEQTYGYFIGSLKQSLAER
jgi:hypothetical protein